MNTWPLVLVQSIFLKVEWGKRCQSHWHWLSFQSTLHCAFWNISCVTSSFVWLNDDPSTCHNMCAPYGQSSDCLLCSSIWSDGVGGPVLVLTVVERLQRAVPSSSHTAYFKHFLIPFEHLLVLGNIDPSTAHSCPESVVLRRIRTTFKNVLICIDVETLCSWTVSV